MIDRLAVGGRIVRWLLLACTVVGLAAMHTLGHAGTHRNSHTGHSLAADWTAAPAAAMSKGSLTTATATLAGAVTAAMGADCAGCAHFGPGAPGHGGVPVWSICLAVLSGLVVVLAALMLARSRRSGLPAGMVAALPSAPRGPPPRRTGLTLATVAVLRV